MGAGLGVGLTTSVVAAWGSMTVAVESDANALPANVTSAKVAENRTL